MKRIPIVRKIHKISQSIEDGVKVELLTRRKLNL